MQDVTLEERVHLYMAVQALNSCLAGVNMLPGQFRIKLTLCDDITEPG